MFLYVCKQTFPKLYGYITREFLGLRMQSFQDSIFIWTRTDREIFKSALVYLWCESILESNSPDILALCEANLDDSIDLCNFSVRDYLHLFRKDFVIHMLGLAVSIKERYPFIQDISLPNFCRSLFMFSTGFTLLSALLLFLPLTAFFIFVDSFCYFM